MSSALALEPDPRCQRGLRFTLRLPEPTPSNERLRAELIAALPEAVVGLERWGQTRVDRLIVQFRVELRIGERPGQIAVLFRSCCPEQERERLAERVLMTVATSYA